MKDSLSKIERLVDGDWHVCRMKELNNGNIFRMLDDDGYRGNCNWVATSEPYITEYDGDEIWGIEANEEGFEV